MIPYRIVPRDLFQSGTALCSSKNNVKSWSYFQSRARSGEEWRKKVGSCAIWIRKKRAQSPSVRETIKKRNKRNKVIDSDNRMLSFLLHQAKGMAEVNERKKIRDDELLFHPVSWILLIIFISNDWNSAQENYKSPFLAGHQRAVQKQKNEREITIR